MLPTVAGVKHGILSDTQDGGDAKHWNARRYIPEAQTFQIECPFKL
jgi:hypothetical protein